MGSIPTALVSSIGQKAVEEVGLLQSGTAGVDDSLSRGSSDELMTTVASSKCSRSHVKAFEKALLTVMIAREDLRAEVGSVAKHDEQVDLPERVCLCPQDHAMEGGAH